MLQLEQRGEVQIVADLRSPELCTQRLGRQVIDAAGAITNVAEHSDMLERRAETLERVSEHRRVQ